MPVRVVVSSPSLPPLDIPPSPQGIPQGINRTEATYDATLLLGLLGGCLMLVLCAFNVMIRITERQLQLQRGQGRGQSALSSRASPGRALGSGPAAGPRETAEGERSIP